MTFTGEKGSCLLDQENNIRSWQHFHETKNFVFDTKECNYLF